MDIDTQQIVVIVVKDMNAQVFPNVLNCAKEIYTNFNMSTIPQTRGLTLKKYIKYKTTMSKSENVLNTINKRLVISEENMTKLEAKAIDSF